MVFCEGGVWGKELRVCAHFRDWYGMLVIINGPNARLCRIEKGGGDELGKQD